jgi:hypothetical protein
MTTITSSFRLVRFSALTVLLAALPLAASAMETPADNAAHLLAATGSVALKAAGPYVEVGTFRVQVAAKLGQPAIRLTDGSWLYKNFEVNNSDASGTLLVRFAEGRVSELALVSPATVVALQSTPKSAPGRILIAAQAQR